MTPVYRSASLCIFRLLELLKLSMITSILHPITLKGNSLLQLQCASEFALYIASKLFGHYGAIMSMHYQLRAILISLV